MLFWIERVSLRLARVSTSGEGLDIVCGLHHERFALFHLFFFSLFGKPTEFQDRLRTGQFLCLEMIHGLSSVKPLLFGQILPVEEAHTSLFPSPGQPLRHCWPMQRHMELLAALEPLPSHLLARGICKAT